jgi:hypothetical protein
VQRNVPAAAPAGNPLPLVIHHVIKQQQLGPGRLVVVGDVHGCLDELQQLLQEVEFKEGSDNLVLVGDLVNKGPKSAEVSRRAWNCVYRHAGDVPKLSAWCTQLCM